MLDIRATAAKLGNKCGQFPGMHALSGCDTVSSVLKVLMNNDIDGLHDVLGEPHISQGQLKATVGAFLSRPLRSQEDRFPEYRSSLTLTLIMFQDVRPCDGTRGASAGRCCIY